jgi:glucose-1-phosphate adenylyltransferase
MANALGIILFENPSVDVAGLTAHRPMPALSFLGRYRLVDFMISNFSNSGINHIHVHVKEKPRPVYEHLGTGRHYNINSKKGKIRVLYGEVETLNKVYNTDIFSMMSNISFLEEDKNEYVIVSSSYMVYTANFEDLLHTHIGSGADVSIISHSTDQAKDKFLHCDTLTIDKDKRVTGLGLNLGKVKTRTISLDTYILKKSLLLKLIKKGYQTSSLYWFNNVIRDELDHLNIRVIPHRGHVFAINSLQAYHQAHMEFLNPVLLRDLFNSNWPILTRTNDSEPTTYCEKAIVSNSIIANGCKISGTVINSVLGRGVVVEEGAVVVNSILLHQTTIGPGIHVEHVVLDKYSSIQHVKELKGSKVNPLYVTKRDSI